MAGCGTGGCDCLIRVGAGLQISGSGALDQPYIIELTGGLGEALSVEDTPTINLTLAGSGTPVDPFVLSAAATIAMTQLADVADPEGGPIAGDGPVWVGPTIGGHFEFKPPVPSPPGAVNRNNSLIGDGSVGAPLGLALVGTSAGGSVGGLEVYLDSANFLRAVPPAAVPADWDDIIDKPSFFPTNDANFSGLLSVAKGGTGANDLALITVGNATLIEGRRIFTQSTTPPTSGIPLNSLWFW